MRRLMAFPHFARESEFFTYLDHRGEVSVQMLLEKYFGEKKFVVPKILEDKVCLFELQSNVHFEKGKFGIREPLSCLPKKSFEEIGVALIPGIAFDKTGHRIGFGGGYFDRLLKKLRCTTIGLAYEFQIIDNVPARHYDVPVDFIVTEKRLILCQRYRPKMQQSTKSLRRK